MSQAAYRDFVIEVVRKLPGRPGFQLLPRRWVVERTFGWMMRRRRLVQDYEERCDVPQTMIGVAMSSLMLPRIALPQQFSSGHLEAKSGARTARPASLMSVS
jgi:hypothetical protein